MRGTTPRQFGRDRRAPILAVHRRKGGFQLPSADSAIGFTLLASRALTRARHSQTPCLSPNAANATS
jgi:hypothetical protein